MLISIQFPFADSRAFLGGKLRMVNRPMWPAVSPDTDFVRSFGSIRKRRLGGLRNWVGEDVLCEANRALRFTKIDNFKDPKTNLSMPLLLAFRRFYFDGLAVGKFEVGLTTDNRDTGHLNRKQYKDLINHFLDLPVIIPALSAKAVSVEVPSAPVSTVLGKVAKPLARFYAACTICHPPPVKLEDWWVIPGAPLLFLVHKFSERLHIPFFGRSIPRSEALRCDLSYYEVPYGDKNLHMWVMGLTPTTTYRDVRALKICLLRLHAEHEAMRLTLQSIATGDLNVAPRTNGSQVLQGYLNQATKKISRLTSKANELSEGDIAELARESEDLINPGEREALFSALANIDMRKNIFQKMTDYVDSEIHIKELYMESKYNITSSQIGAVGDHAQATNFTQWSQSGGDLKTLVGELASLRVALGKDAKEPEQFESATAVAKAEAAAKEGDGPGVFGHLKNAGKWAFDVATRIGASLAAEVIKKQIGL